VKRQLEKTLKQLEENKKMRLKIRDNVDADNRERLASLDSEILQTKENALRVQEATKELNQETEEMKRIKVEKL